MPFGRIGQPEWCWVEDKDEIVRFVGNLKACKRWWKRHGGSRDGYDIFRILASNSRPVVGSRYVRRGFREIDPQSVSPSIPAKVDEPLKVVGMALQRARSAAVTRNWDEVRRNVAIISAASKRLLEDV